MIKKIYMNIKCMYVIPMHFFMENAYGNKIKDVY